MVDFVGKFENLQEDFDEICNKISVEPISLTVQNSSIASQNKKHSSGIHWAEHYKRNPDAIKLVYKN